MHSPYHVMADEVDGPEFIGPLTRYESQVTEHFAFLELQDAFRKWTDSNTPSNRDELDRALAYFTDNV